MAASRFNRRSALKMAAAAIASPLAFRVNASAAPGETVRHASFGASGMAWSDIQSLSSSKNFKLVAVADVDLARTEQVRKRFPDARIYQDWRELSTRRRNSTRSISPRPTTCTRRSR